MMKLCTVRLTGPKNRKFLQAYTTSCWLNKTVGWSAFLNQKGRVVSIAHITCVDETQVLCILPAEVAYGFIEHLKPFLKFARLEVAIEQAEPKVLWDIKTPTPWILAQHQALFTAHDLSLDILGYIAFDKGCYLGQEIVARMEARITHQKKRLVLMSTNNVLPEFSVLYDEDGLSLCVVSRHDFPDLKTHQIWDNSPIELNDKTSH